MTEFYPRGIKFPLRTCKFIVNIYPQQRNEHVQYMISKWLKFVFFSPSIEQKNGG
jgi:hypothetical protein